MDYGANAGQTVAYQKQEMQEVAVDERMTTRIRQRAHRHVGDINELATNVKMVADQLFGMEPMPENPPTQAGMLGHPSGGLEPIRPQFDMIEREQFMMDEALETLRRQLSRFGNI